MSESFSRALLVLICVGMLVSCISTTTGRTPPEGNDANAADVNFQLAIRYFQNGKYELSRDRLLQSIKLDPKRGMAWSTLAITYEQLGNLRLAEDSHDQAAKLSPRDFNVQNAYAVFLCQQERYDDAEQQFSRSIKALTNDNPEVMYTNAGVCMMQKPDYVTAENYFRQALQRAPNHGEALLQMALLKFGTEDYLGARAFLQRFRGANRVSPGVLYLCVIIEEKQGDERARDECANELLRDFPDSQESRRLLQSG